MEAQISLDLMLAITVALIVVGAIGVVSNEATEMQRQASVRDQLDLLGIELASIISTSRILNDATSAKIEFTVPKILVPGEIKPQPCDITISGNEITLKYDLFDIETGISTEVKVTKEFVDAVGMDLPASLKCGEKLIISRGG